MALDHKPSANFVWKYTDIEGAKPYLLLFTKSLCLQ